MHSGTSQEHHAEVTVRALLFQQSNVLAPILSYGCPPHSILLKAAQAAREGTAVPQARRSLPLLM
jgi:hypothetical protein